MPTDESICSMSFDFRIKNLVVLRTKLVPLFFLDANKIDFNMKTAEFRYSINRIIQIVFWLLTTNIRRCSQNKL